MFDDIFADYYKDYRGEITSLAETDEEYILGLSYANRGITRWEHFDGTYWKQLFTTAQTNSTGGVVVISTGVTSYAAPTAMREAGGYVKLKSPTTGATQRHIPIIEPEEAQFKSDQSTYCYFTGDPNNGFVLHLNGAPTADMNGFLIDYVYYKKATRFTNGASTTEVPDEGYIADYMLAKRFRVSRNYSSYQTALRDAEEALKNMQRENNSGTWANPWQLQDNSGSIWGEGNGGGGFF
jgi:hypothetical protein